MLLWIWCHLSVFCLWSGAKIRKFQEDYEDGDLWIFFAFSLLFVVAVCVGLWTMAEVTTLIAEGNSWLKSTYYYIKNIILRHSHGHGDTHHGGNKRPPFSLY